jgi:hypothetical protein
VAVNASATITSLELGANANSNGNSLRGAVTTDGTAFWTASEGSTQGIAYTATAGTSTIIAGANIRWPFIAGGQLYVTSGAGMPGRGIHAVGTGLPTAAAGFTLVPGTNTSGMGNPSPYGALALDTDATAGIDTVYVCDDRITASGGGIQRWKLEGATWALKATFASPTGCRGVTGWVDGANVYLVVTTVEVTTGTAAPSRVLAMVDTVAGLATATPVTLGEAAANDTFRGVALAPVP